MEGVTLGVWEWEGMVRKRTGWKGLVDGRGRWAGGLVSFVGSQCARRSDSVVC